MTTLLRGRLGALQSDGNDYTISLPFDNCFLIYNKGRSSFCFIWISEDQNDSSAIWPIEIIGRMSSDSHQLNTKIVWLSYDCWTTTITIEYHCYLKCSRTLYSFKTSEISWHCWCTVWVSKKLALALQLKKKVSYFTDNDSTVCVLSIYPKPLIRLINIKS